MDVSVVIACHNYDKYLSRAIRSVINQTMDKRNYEIIVVDDGSTDTTKKIIASYAGWLRNIILPANVGLAEARNEGIRLALGRFVVNVDADDYVDENLLLVEALYLKQNSNIDAVSCDYHIVDDHENHIGRFSGSEHPIACGVMFRKELLFEIGLYDPSFRVREEEDLRKRFSSRYQIKNIDFALYRYRKHDKNLTSNKQLMDEYDLRLQEKHN